MRAVNSAIMREINRTLILDLIRKRPISRAELAEETELTPPSVSAIINELISEGIVVETMTIGGGKLGRRRTQLEINPNARKFIGINLGRKQCSIGVINLRGEVLAHVKEPVEGREAKEVLDSVEKNILRLKDELMLDARSMESIGFCAPGSLDVRSGEMLNPRRFPKWYGVRTAEILAQRLNTRVLVENVANAHALDEYYFGCAASDNFALIRMDESLGAGVVVDGHLYHGAHRHAVELGHICMESNGAECDCGNRGCLENCISSESLLKGTPYRTFAELMTHSDDPEVVDRSVRLVKYLSYGIITVLNLFDVDKIVLAGELSHLSKSVLYHINRIVSARALIKPSDPPVVLSTFGDPARIAALPVLQTEFASN